MKRREFAGAIRDAQEILVPVHFAPGEQGLAWVPISKAVAREYIRDALKEFDIREINAELKKDEEGVLCLFIDGPTDEEEAAAEAAGGAGEAEEEDSANENGYEEEEEEEGHEEEEEEERGAER